MADFSMFSDSDEDKRVEELLSQAMDESVLQQISAINCSGFIDNSVLPTHLQTRFNNLKSGGKTGKPPSLNSHKNIQFHMKKEEQQDPDDNDDDDSIQQNTKSELGSSTESEKGLESKSRSRNIELKEPNPAAESAVFGKKRFSKKESKSRNGDEFEFGSSPTKRIGCLWCSPKRVFSKKNKGGGGDDGISVVDWEKDDDLSRTFSTKGQEKLWKKLMREEEKINREAEKIVKWAKQASARMEVEGLHDDDDELSDT